MKQAELNHFKPAFRLGYWLLNQFYDGYARPARKTHWNFREWTRISGLKDICRILKISIAPWFSLFLGKNLSSFLVNSRKLKHVPALQPTALHRSHLTGAQQSGMTSSGKIRYLALETVIMPSPGRSERYNKQGTEECSTFCWHGYIACCFCQDSSCLPQYSGH